MNELSNVDGSLVSRALNDFSILVEMVKRTISQSTARIYGQTYRLWAGWCRENGLSPYDLIAPNVSEFLIDQYVTRGTRQRMLSALRTLAETLAMIDYQSPEREMAYKTLKRMRAPTENASDEERIRRALSPQEANAILSVWVGDSNKHLRNQAMIAVLLMTGVRRGEAIQIKWDDVDLEEGVILIRHGKGDKEREVAIYGDEAIDALKRWKKRMGDREYLFPAVYIRDTIGEDKPITGSTIYRVVKETEELANLGHFSPHDARRTLITELLASGTPVADAQAQAGHSQAQTTLRYAQSADARRRRKEANLRYGNNTDDEDQ